MLATSDELGVSYGGEAVIENGEQIRSLVWDMLRCRWLCADAKEIAADRVWSPEEIYLLESKSYKYVNGV